jgi:CPA2 family monovalent cation:H+ antiporter-2
MHELPLLVNIAVALAYALAGGLVARRLGLPTIVGYMLAGVALGPVTPGFQGDPEAIHQLAEFGVILLMFGVGLRFSFHELWQVKDIAIPGAVAQMAVITVAGYLMGRHWGFSTGGAWVFGLALSVASTVVLMRGLMDHGWLDTIHGKVAVGWLVFEDLATVAILVLLPVLGSATSAGAAGPAALALGKAVAFVVLMLFVGKFVFPALLGRIVYTRSRELFVLVALTVAVGTALASSYLFEVSLALGAFVAGVVVSESPFSHQIGADLLPFREAFAVIFFVSVGMLVRPAEMLAHWDQVLLVTLLIIVGKAVVSAGIALASPYPVRTALVVAAGRSQIGEFSFIVGQASLALGFLTDAQYSLILAGAIVSITVNPFMLRLVDPVERQLRRRPRLWRLIDRRQRHEEGLAADHLLTNHVVIVGCGRVGRHIAETLGRLGIPRLVIEVDPARLDKLRELKVPVLYGDAGNSEILLQASLPQARALIVTLPDDAAALAVVDTAHGLAPDLHVVARASTWDGARLLRAAGATEVIRPELEGGVEIVRRTLLELKLPIRDVQRYTDIVRREGLDESNRPSADQARVLHDLVGAARDLEVGWVLIAEGSPLAGRTLATSNLRTNAGVSVVAIGRHERLISNPGPDEVLRVGDRVAVIGTPAEVIAAEAFTEVHEGDPVSDQDRTSKERT